MKEHWATKMMDNSASTATPATTASAVLGQTLATLRKAKGLNQGYIADKIGVSTSNWSRIEKGESSISVDQLRLVADILDVYPEDIIRAARVGEKEAESKGIRVVISPLSVAALASSLSLGSKGAAVGAAALGSVAIPVVGPVLGAVIGAAVAGYFVSRNLKKD